ncbi:TIM barrel protein [Paraburkholderia phenazinium]|uniref:Xylose isomerase-like TIM barrel n=1 Tax=Paraburkholderia phenazinium TaxID=60549 RepID=A0A1G8BUY9_9BURK|nr:TIM barrel protein [Paraburkholderia phenazinium]SDH36889.1 Xylose isomerase-like TIM barrel [Paraburkholderia phenazinium]
MSEVAIVASAFGADAIRSDGHAVWAEVAARAGAAAFEVRCELFAAEAQAGLPALRALGETIAAHGMWPVFSTPATLYTASGALDEAALRLATAQADALGARFVKLQLGGFGAGTGEAGSSVNADRARDDFSFSANGQAHAYGARIAACLQGVRARLVVENGQLREGGLLVQFASLFDALQREGRADVLGMTFDIGNWQWPGEAPLEAARQLAPRVEYIHCKAVAGEGARRFAVAPAADDPSFAAALRLLPREAPRGIEFPFDTSRAAADASHYVAWLASA